MSQSSFADQLRLSIELGYRSEFYRCRTQGDRWGEAFFYTLWHESMQERFRRVIKPWLDDSDTSGAHEPLEPERGFNTEYLGVWSMEVPPDTILRSLKRKWNA